MKKIAIFYHILQDGEWEEIYCQQIARLQQSGLFDAADHLHIGVNGNQAMPFTLTRNHILARNKTVESEFETLNSLYNFSLLNDDYFIFYFNALGVTWSHKDKKDNIVKTPIGPLSYGTIGKNKMLWRKYLEYFTIDNWRSCIQELDSHDCVGAELHHSGVIENELHNESHFSGNFWWTKSEYIRTLDLNYMIDSKFDRFSCEFWVASNKPKCKSLFTFDKNLYCYPVEESEYKNNMKKIAIFYHVLQKNNWKELFVEQMEAMKKSGLYDAADLIHIGINGTETGPPISDYDKVTVRYNSYMFSAKETMTSFYEFSCQNPGYAILYFCNLGVTHYGYPSEINKTAWRKYLSFFVIDRWERCVKKLENHDCVGTQWCEIARLTKNYIAVHAPHFEGEFWWANSEYIKTLELKFLDEKFDFVDENVDASTYYRGEFWIGSKNPKVFNFYTSEVTPYWRLLEESEYSKYANSEESYDISKSGRETVSQLNKMQNKNMAENGRICMISMFKNEAKSIGTMLESVAPYIDYWVLQDNGSTDGTPEVVKAWQEKYKIPGFMYKVEEGWVGFGWNRDHVLLKARESNHNCQWIMKMDCDETLIVEDGFDWSVLNNHEPQSYDVHAWSPGCQYFRTWIWRADLPWRFNHDPAHETVYIDDGVTKENYTRATLPLEFKMTVGSVAGESYSSPTKYISDALKLEEKLIREGTMLQNHYHFFYVGKSYEDGYPCDTLPLGKIHQEEMARRCIWYFEEVLNVTHPGFKETRKAHRIDEMSYYAMNVMGKACRFLGQHYKAIEYYEGAEQFAPEKNDHLILLAEIYWELLDFKKMLTITTRLVDPFRKNPFPRYNFVINPNSYVDTGNLPRELHNIALERSRTNYVGTTFALTRNPRKKLFVVDNFYEDPDLVREYALSQDFNGDLRFYKGKRTIGRHSTPQIKQRFEEIMGEKITRWDSPSEEFGGSMNGVFQYCTPEDALVYHYDSQKWAAMIFLTPDAPTQTGTSFYKHKETGIKVAEDPDADRAFAGGFYDATKFELIDTVGNIYNRCVIFDARQIHAATEYFGQTKDDSRLFQIFFFD